MRRGLTDAQVERVLSGRGGDEPELAGVAGVIEELRAAYVQAPPTEVRTAHLAAMAEALRSAPARPRRRRFAFKVAVATGALVLAGGSALAVGGALPRPAQDAVADAARTVGLDLPGGRDARGVPARGATPPARPAPQGVRPERPGARAAVTVPPTAAPPTGVTPHRPHEARPGVERAKGRPSSAPPVPDHAEGRPQR
jgi:hypothetical protein